jgi:hypothetical protein
MFCPSIYFQLNVPLDPRYVVLAELLLNDSSHLPL